MHIKTTLKVATGLASDAGPNEQNDDCLGIRIPEGEALVTKGVAAIVADGVSVAEAGKQAAEISVQGFLSDYFDAPEAWSSQTCGTKVYRSLNRWLYSLSQDHSKDGRGYVTTATAIVLKGASAYVFHVGDTRLYRWRKGNLDQITRDHSVNFGKGDSGLSRALGMDTGLDVETHDFAVEQGDRYLITSDGIHGFITSEKIAEVVSSACSDDLDKACRSLCQAALEAGGNDNCTALLLEVEQVDVASREEYRREFSRLPFPPDLAPGMKLDGFEIVSEIQSTKRSQTYLAQEIATGKRFVLKTPSVNFEDDAGYIERFIMESWIGRKVKHERLAAAFVPPAGQQFLYTLLEYIEGESLEQWMRLNPKPDVRQATRIAREVTQGLRSMHRMEMLHQDIKPSNVILHPERGSVIIDYGSTRVAGLHEIQVPFQRLGAVGTLGYSAPEYFLGKKATRKSDLFSVGVMLYEILTGKLPYGERYENCQSLRDFTVLKYIPATRYNSHVPVWLDGAIAKAVSINPLNRYDSFSEFEYDLEHPNPKYLPQNAGPFIERHPLRFWKIVSGLLLVGNLVAWWWILRG